MVMGPGKVIFTARSVKDWATRQSWGKKGALAATGPTIRGRSVS